MKQFSIIILTFKEEENIRRCLDSINDFTDDIIIVDSFSTDATLKICEDYGCRIYQHKFVNQAIQFNWALDNLPLERPWILRLDCDEVLPTKLKQELVKLAATSDSDVTGIYRRQHRLDDRRRSDHLPVVSVVLGESVSPDG